jgi:hypothetical protein
MARVTLRPPHEDQAILCNFFMGWNSCLPPVGQPAGIATASREKELRYAALKCEINKGDQLRVASFFLSGKPIAAASFTS